MLFSRSVISTVLCASETHPLLRKSQDSPPLSSSSRVVPVIYLQQEFLRVDQCDALGRGEQTDNLDEMVKLALNRKSPCQDLKGGEVPSVGEEEEGVEGRIRAEESVCGIFIFIIISPFFSFSPPHLLKW